MKNLSEGNLVCLEWHNKLSMRQFGVMNLCNQDYVKEIIVGWDKA